MALIRQYKALLSIFSTIIQDQNGKEVEIVRLKAMHQLLDAADIEASQIMYNCRYFNRRTNKCKLNKSDKEQLCSKLCPLVDIKEDII